MMSKDKYLSIFSLQMVAIVAASNQFPEPGSFDKFRMYIAAFASISSNRNRGSFDSEENLHHQSGIDVKATFSRAKSLKVSEGCTNSYD